MLVEDGLNFVKVGNVAKPAVETFEQDDVDAIGADVIKKALQLLAARNGLAGGATLIGIDPDDEVVVLIGILGKIVLLLSEREAVPGLLFGADTDIDGCSYHKNHLINVKKSWYQQDRSSHPCYYNRQGCSLLAPASECEWSVARAALFY